MSIFIWPTSFHWRQMYNVMAMQYCIGGKISGKSVRLAVSNCTNIVRRYIRIISLCKFTVKKTLAVILCIYRTVWKASKKSHQHNRFETSSEPIDSRPSNWFPACSLQSLPRWGLPQYFDAEFSRRDWRLSAEHLTGFEETTDNNRVSVITLACVR